MLGGTLRRPPAPGQCQTPVVRLRYPTNRKGQHVQVSQDGEFSLTKPKSEVPFTTLNVSLKKFKVLRSDFEDLSLRVEVLDFYKK